jgi:putative redox protein
MTTAETIYTGELRTKAIHCNSGISIITDAPVDNHGKGESFSPTDLLATSLGSCMLTIMGIEADKRGFDIDGTKVSITKIMSSDPRRVSAVDVVLRFPHNNYTDQEKRLLSHISKTCPVALSLHPEISQNVTIYYGSEQ